MISASWSWIVPAAVTSGVWAYTIFKPYPPSQSQFDFSTPFIAMARVAASIILTLSVWLAYFASRFIFG